MNILDLSLMVWIVALSAASLVPIIRQISYVQKKMFEGVKPWVCDLCMSFWSTSFSATVWYIIKNVPVYSILPAFTITFYLVRKNSEHIGLPPSVPELEDTE